LARRGDGRGRHASSDSSCSVRSAASSAAASSSRSPSRTFRQLVDRQPDAVIRDTALREVVGADPLAPLARPDLALARRGDLGPLLLLRLLEQPRSQHAHRLGAVLDLGALVLAGHHEAGGRYVMRTAESVVLTPCPPGPDER
jgi:hypothetical protein